MTVLPPSAGRIAPGQHPTQLLASQQPPKHRMRDLLLGVAGLVVASVATAASVFGLVLPLARGNQHAVAWVEHTQESLAAIGRLETNLEAAETDRRGFLLTAEAAYLGPTVQGDAIWRSFFEVRRLTADDPRQQDHLQELSSLITAKLGRIAETIELAKQGDVKGAVDALRNHTGKHLMLRIRGTMADMIGEEERRLQERRTNEKLFEARSTNLLVLLCIVGFGGVLLCCAMFLRAAVVAAARRRDLAAEAERQRLLKIANAAAVMVHEFNGTIVFWSEGCRRLYGWTAEQAIGRMAGELLGTVFPVSQADTETELKRNGVWNGELHRRNADGGEVIILAHKFLHDPADQTSPLVVENVTDVSALRRAETEVRGHEAQIHSLVDTAADGIIIASSDGQIRSVNPALTVMFGYDRADELIGRNLRVLLPEGEAALHDIYVANYHAGAPPRVIGVPGRALLAVRRDGSAFPIDLSLSSFGINGSRRLTGIIRDATARRQAEAALRDSEERMRLFIEGAPAAIAMFDSAMCYLAVSHRFLRDYRLDDETPASLIGRSQYEVFPEVPERWRAIHRRVLAGETVSADDDPFPRVDGRIDWQRWEMVPWRHADGTIGGALLFTESMTERKASEAAVHESEARLRLVQQVGGIAYLDRRLPETASLISAEAARMYGLPPEQTVMSLDEWIARVHPEDRARMAGERSRLVERGGPVATEFRIVRTDGAVRWISLRAEVFSGPGDTEPRVVVAQHDITDIVAAREALAARREELERRVAERTAELGAAEARFRGIFDSQFQFISLLAADGSILEMNRTALDAAALTREHIIGRPFWETTWWPAEEHDRLRQEIADAAQGAVIHREVEVRGPRGQSMWIDFSLKPVRDPTTDAVMWIIAESRDLTEKRDLATQLAQAQKMQALGQLAGGIAHDFNNILQAVGGAAGLIEQRPGDQDRTRRLASTMIAAANRGASITQRLLSFARRGDLRSDVIDTAGLLKSICEVLAHTLGAAVSVSTDVARGVPALVADQAQLETAIINLSTNARDAMPDGGTLLLSAEAEHVGPDGRHRAGLAPGDYVRLSVADTGTGMNAATLGRVSEPFFTTKPRGQGTGLGVAMVKGFAEQSGGALLIASSPGAGTTVTMWLRQAVGEASGSGRDEDVELPGAGHSARILVVDDDDLVRETVAFQLEAEGFATLAAAGGIEALALLQSGEAVDAMVSDLSMPGMSGLTTIQRARVLRPGLPCFLMTGYVGERAALSAENIFTLVRKPVTGRALAAQLEACLAGAKR